MNKEKTDVRPPKTTKSTHQKKSQSAGTKNSKSIGSPEKYGNSAHQSFDFLQYFAAKLTKLQGDNQVTAEILDSCKESAQKALLFFETLKLREEEAFSLNQCLNEAQIALYEERENFIKLSAEHEKLKVERDDFRRKFQTALLLSGHSEKDVTHFLQRHPRANQLTDEMIEVKKQIRSCSGEKLDEFETRDCGMLRKDIKRLETALKDSRAFHENHIQSFKKAFSLTKKEFSDRIEQLGLSLSETIDQVKEKTALLHASLTHNVELQKRIVMAEEEWMTERKRLVKSHAHSESQTDVKGNPTSLARLDGKLPDVEDQTATVKRLERNSVRLENEVLEKENVILELKMIIIRMEKQMNRLREETDEYKKTYEGEKKGLADRNLLLRRQLEQTEMRRKLDGAGFRADVAQIRKLLLLVEKTLQKVLEREREKRAKQVEVLDSEISERRPLKSKSRNVMSSETGTSKQVRVGGSEDEVRRRGTCGVVIPLPATMKVKGTTTVPPRLMSQRALKKLLEVTKEKVRILDTLIKKRMLEGSDEPS